MSKKTSFDSCLLKDAAYSGCGLINFQQLGFITYPHSRHPSQATSNEGWKKSFVECGHSSSRENQLVGLLNAAHNGATEGACINLVL